MSLHGMSCGEEIGIKIEAWNGGRTAEESFGEKLTPTQKKELQYETESGRMDIIYSRRQSLHEVEPALLRLLSTLSDTVNVDTHTSTLR